MDYAFFERLTPADAERELASYLVFGDRAVAGAVPQIEAGGGRPDFSLGSIPEVLAWFAGRVQVVRVDPPDGTPDWITEAMEDHHGGFLEFEDDSQPLVLAGAYYLGASFVRSGEGLKWSVGRENRAEVSQPVVSGFRTGADLPAIVVGENLLLDWTLERCATAVETWRAAI